VKLLAVETATSAGSVALWDGRRISRADVDLRGAGALPAVSELLARERVPAGDIDAVAVSVGPGSFTGVRIGVALAQGFCLGNGAKAVAVGTLEALAESAVDTDWGVEGTLLLPSVDARRGEVYAALYRIAARGEPPARLWGPEPVSLAAFARRFAELLPSGTEAPGVLLGDGAALLLPMLPARSGWSAPARLGRTEAVAVARVGARRAAEGHAVDPGALEPVYLRKSDAEIHREERLRQG
jgi:tRNA threonylcarbamoyladenosine biosynthesis protein TsaB